MKELVHKMAALEHIFKFESVSFQKDMFCLKGLIIQGPVKKPAVHWVLAEQTRGSAGFASLY